MSMKIGFFGDGPWSHKSLDLLLNNADFEVRFICIRSDPGDEHLIKIAEQESIPLLQNRDINSKEFLSTLSSYNCDIFVSLAFNQIFKKNLIELPPLGIINCHAGKLPEYRGRNILNWALINDENEFGITVHYVDEGIDTGDIILQKTFKINDSDTYKTLLGVAFIQCGEIVQDALSLIKKKKAARVKQDSLDIQGFYCVGRGEGDENIDWSMTSRELFNFIRAVTYPGPNAKATLNKKNIELISAEYIPDAPKYKGIPGSVVGKSKDYFLIKTSDSHLKITKIKYDGKIKIGDRLE